MNGTSMLTPVGQPFRTRLTSNSQCRTLVVCECKCGTRDIFMLSNIRKRPDMSCGCARDEATRLRNTKHGKSHSRTFNIWLGMIRRCTDEKHSSFVGYGGRGIQIDESWKRFEAFYADMGECPSSKHSIDRIDPKGNYTKGNCRWLHLSQQSANRTCSHKLFDGEEVLSLAAFSRKHGVGKACLLRRVRAGITDPSILKQKSKFRGWCKDPRKSARHALNNAKARCRHSFAGYSDRGISMCERWMTGGLQVFIEDMGLPQYGQTLERIDVNGDYCPENCRWASRDEQARNKRNNVHISVNGQTKTVAEWSRETGIGAGTISARMRRYNWPAELAVTLPKGASINPPRTGEKHVV